MSKAGTTFVAFALAAALALPAGVEQAWGGSPPFEEHEIPVKMRLLFDLVVVDFNGDDELDVFTTNHNDPQALLANRGNGVFEDRLSAMELNQSPEFPGFERVGEPSIPKNGIYLFRIEGADQAEGGLGLVVRETPLEEVNGTLEFALPVTVREADDAEVSTEVDTGRVPPRYVLSFTAESDAQLEVEPEQMAAPIDVSIENDYPPSSVFVGPFHASPRSHRFTLHLRDRHGMAWGDYNRDGRLDAFITRGGLKGRAAGLGTGFISDELMLRRGGRFVDAIASSGLMKGSCRGREAAPVDINGDGRLDLFWGCQAARPALYRQNPNGTFSDVSHQLGRARIGGQDQHAGIGEHFEWLDINGKGREELIVTKKHKLIVYGWRPRKRRWSKRDAIPTRAEGAPGRLAIADFDTDGDPDIFAPSATGNTLLVNRSGRFRARSPGSLGLPKTGSFTAGWVDYDNDGRTDLHAFPQGIFRRVGARRFEETGLASAPDGTFGAFATWFDYNADGARDLLMARADGGWSAVLLENHLAGNHWLEVELTGKGDSYPAAGASVTVRAQGRRQTQWVGQNDGSDFSQGHYRLYFGLGDATEARSVKVEWADGSKRKLRRVPVDRLLHVSFGRP